MILDIDDEEFSDLRAAVLLHFKGTLRELARAPQRPLLVQLREKCDRIEQLVSKLSTAAPSPNSAPY